MVVVAGVGGCKLQAVWLLLAVCSCLVVVDFFCCSYLCCRDLKVDGGVRVVAGSRSSCTLPLDVSHGDVVINTSLTIVAFVRVHFQFFANLAFMALISIKRNHQ